MTHFSKGSEKPVSKTDGLRLYSMRFCPYAQVNILTFCARRIKLDSHSCERPASVFISSAFFLVGFLFGVLVTHSAKYTQQLSIP